MAKVSFGEEVYLARNWWPLLLIGILIFPGLIIVWEPVLYLIEAMVGGNPLPSVRWWDVIGLSVLILAPGAVGYWIVLQSLLVKFTEQGISQPVLFRWKFIRWSQVTRAVDRFPLVRISSSSETIEFNILSFRDRRKVNEVLAKYLPPDYEGP